MREDYVSMVLNTSHTETVGRISSKPHPFDFARHGVVAGFEPKPFSELCIVLDLLP